MSFFGVHILTDAALAHLKAAGHEVILSIATPVQHAVAALMSTDLGKVVVGDIQAVAAHDMTGAEKFEHVVANTLPAIVSLLATGGIASTNDEVESIGRELVQTAYNAVASTTAGRIAGAILGLHGIK